MFIFQNNLAFIQSVCSNLHLKGYCHLYGKLLDQILRTILFSIDRYISTCFNKIIILAIREKLQIRIIELQMISNILQMRCKLETETEVYMSS